MEKKESMYKVGDKVVIAQRKGGIYDYPFFFVDNMAYYSGKIATIREVEDRSEWRFDEKYYNGDCYAYRLEEFGYDWHSSMFEPYGENDTKINNMEQKVIIIDGVEYICTPKQSEQPQDVKRWRDNEDAYIDGYWIGASSDIERLNASKLNCKCNHNVFATEKQAKSTLAMAQISQIMANDTRFGGTITDEEWQDENLEKYIICRFNGEVKNEWVYQVYHFLTFHTHEQRELFLEENMDLVKDFLML